MRTDGPKNLSDLKYLSLEGNGIVDLTPITKLKKVEFLGLAKNKIENFQILENLIRLKYVSLYENPVRLCVNKRRCSWRDMCLKEKEP